MHTLVTQKKPAFDAALDRLAEDLSSLRTGRATPALVEHVKVVAYDSVMELNTVASITAQDARTLVIQPWDKGLLQAIEKGIRDANLGVSPAVDGEIVRLVMPMMTEENRKNLVKLMKEKLEEAKVALRKAREDAREAVIKMEKEKKIGEDEKFKILEELDKMTKEYTQKVEDVGKKKEAEIMTV
jgi:ribosome recycling factor